MLIHVNLKKGIPGIGRNINDANGMISKLAKLLNECLLVFDLHFINTSVTRFDTFNRYHYDGNLTQTLDSIEWNWLKITIGWGNAVALNRRQVIIWTNDDSVNCSIHPTKACTELKLLSGALKTWNHSDLKSTLKIGFVMIK